MPPKKWARWKDAYIRPFIKFYATWWQCKECGFRFMRQKHEEKICDLCGGEGVYSHLVLLNKKYRYDWR